MSTRPSTLIGFTHLSVTRDPFAEPGVGFHRRPRGTNRRSLRQRFARRAR